jgi:hypothetical protein
MNEEFILKYSESLSKREKEILIFLKNYKTEKQPYFHEIMLKLNPAETQKIKSMITKARGTYNKIQQLMGTEGDQISIVGYYARLNNLFKGV